MQRYPIRPHPTRARATPTDYAASLGRKYILALRRETLHKTLIRVFRGASDKQSVRHTRVVFPISREKPMLCTSSSIHSISPSMFSGCWSIVGGAE
jgi:hypothetical protein